MSASNYLSKQSLDGVLGSGSPATIYVALYTATPADAGGGTEVTGAGYSRKAVTNNATNWPASTGTTTATKSNGTTIAFDTATDDYPGPVVGWGLFDASSSGNLLFWGNLVGEQLLFTASASDDIVRCPGHTFVDGNAVRIEQIVGSTLPTGLSQSTTYYVRDTSGETFKLAASAGGSAVDITASGAGLIARFTPKTVGDGDQFSFAANSITIIAD